MSSDAILSIVFSVGLVAAIADAAWQWRTKGQVDQKAAFRWFWRTLLAAAIFSLVNGLYLLATIKR
jgi:hypothetical protein